MGFRLNDSGWNVYGVFGEYNQNNYLDNSSYSTKDLHAKTFYDHKLDQWCISS